MYRNTCVFDKSSFQTAPCRQHAIKLLVIFLQTDCRLEKIPIGILRLVLRMNFWPVWGSSFISHTLLHIIGIWKNIMKLVAGITWACDNTWKPIAGSSLALKKHEILLPGARLALSDRSLARSGSIWLDLVRSGLLWLDVARSGSIWLDLARSGSLWL